MYIYTVIVLSRVRSKKLAMVRYDDVTALPFYLHTLLYHHPPTQKYPASLFKSIPIPIPTLLQLLLGKNLPVGVLKEDWVQMIRDKVLAVSDQDYTHPYDTGCTYHERDDLIMIDTTTYLQTHIHTYIHTDDSFMRFTLTPVFQHANGTGSVLGVLLFGDNMPGR